MAPGLNFENPVFAYFAFHAGVVIVKTLLMGPLTAVRRNINKAFANDEDAVLFGPKDKQLKVNLADSDTERIRRCHLNDLENIIPFVLIGLLYVLTGPSIAVAAYHFRAFTACRIFYTVAYLMPLPQPSRTIAFVVGWGVTISMTISVLAKASI